MSAPAGFLEFFILEAGDYVEQLDGVLLRGGVAGPDGEALLRAARALRGTATMAKLPTFADVASSIERVGRALQDGVLRWDPALGGALIAAVDDLKILLRGARNWSAAEDQRATARAAELTKYAPARAASAPRNGSAPTPAQPAAPSPTAHLATEASNIAAGLELLATRAGDPETAANVLRRVRALRGIAGVKEITALADVLEATEDAARGLETKEEVMSPDARQLLEASAAYLRTLASALRGSDGDINAPGSSRDAFHAALDAWTSRSDERERVVPIAELFYRDGTPGLIEAAQNPPTSVAARFRLELVSLGEHLRQVVDAARRATDHASTTRARRDLRNALRALQGAASSFGDSAVAALVGEHVEAVNHADFLSLAALDDLASVLADPNVSGEQLGGRLNAIRGDHGVTTEIAAESSQSQPPSPPQAPVAPERVAPERVAPERVAPERVAPERVAPMLTPSITPSVPPSVGPSASLLDSTIASLESLGDMPFVTRAEIPEEAVVPIESLLYRGRAALDRALEIRDELKLAGAPHDQDALEELFDLVELARVEHPV
jgi:chemotaxis protein histidine kinase CheA